MSADVTDYPDVFERASQLGLRPPAGLAFLPRGFDVAADSATLAEESDTATIRKLFRVAGLEVDDLAPRAGPLPTVIQRSADWIAPTLFIGSMLLTQNPHAVTFALGVLQNYVADLLRKPFRNKTVELHIVVETQRQRTYKKITYKGDAAGIKDLAALIDQVSHD